ncbi:MAG: class II aldolase/adducin family protein [Clostridia bacterium]|nr:class II aldolase/adducin family protein [Clostridia bacterium]
MIQLESLKKEMLEVGRRLYEKGFVASNDGNLTARIDEDTILATPTGVCKGDMTPEHLLVLDMNGAVMSGSYRPTSELKMHLAVYQERPDVRAVVHAHPQKATAYAVAGIPLDKITLPEMVFALGKINLTEYGTPSTEEIPETVRRHIRDANALLLLNHGALTVGIDLMEAYFAMETLEHFAAISLYAHLLGGAKEISKQKIDRLFEVRSRTYGKCNYIFNRNRLIDGHKSAATRI